MSLPHASPEERPLDLPTTHRVPVSWLVANGGPAVKFRTLAELAPPGSVSADVLTAAVREAVLSPAVTAVTTRQQVTGLWDDNFLAFEGGQKEGGTEPGTVAQYRRLLQLGVPTTTRPFRLADRVLFRTLSRDDDPLLYGEFFEATEKDPDLAEAARNHIREGVCSALAEAGHEHDPRLRGAAHKVISAVSAFLRSDLSADPFVKRSGGGWTLHPEAAPPSWWSVAMLAAMPSLQRERAGFVERLGQYLSQPAPETSFMVNVGGVMIKPTHVLLGNPIELDQKGYPRDVPLALHFIELLSGLGQLHASAVASDFVAKLFADVDEAGIWHPKNLRSQPKAMSPVTHHFWPLAADEGDLASRQADITFRLALVAKRLGLPLEFT